MPPEHFTQGRAVIEQRASGRPFTLSVRLEVDMSGKLPTQFSGPDGTLRRRLGATTAGIARDIEQYAEVGVSHVVLVLRDDDRDSLVQHMAQIAREVIRPFRERR
jgi:hypothetical protein